MVRAPDGVSALARFALDVRGQVQGVGFRPYVHGLAHRHGLSGFVRNETSGVHIEVEGPRDAIDRFTFALEHELPRHARVTRIGVHPIEVVGERQFSIASSAHVQPDEVTLPVDVAPCADCVRELLDPGERRYRYPFLACTVCGPRMSILRELPYDRGSTAMSVFAMCAACRREHDDPGDRRFHAQSLACPACGPRLAALSADGSALPGDPLERAVDAIRAGRIIAMKGIGGYHLACDARRSDVVRRLRAGKLREAKPFAIMVLDLAHAERLGELDTDARAALVDPARPIVLVPARAEAGLAAEIAPGSALCGLMLPSSPLHHLLLRDLGGTPLVMTSGNVADEPLVHADEQALARLGGIAELFLTHDRPIVLRCDDSVVRPIAGTTVPVRRARGQAPAPVALPRSLRSPTLATGGLLKACFALGQGGRAVLSPHLGDLDRLDSYRAFEEAIAHFERLLGGRPTRLVHDLHPDYPTTRWAEARATAEGLERIAVQHHHAHMAACLAEHGVTGPAIGVVFDGSGHGSDGTPWGGEIFVGDLARVERVAHLSKAALPGGDHAAREPWRCALARLHEAGLPLDRIVQRVPAAQARTMEAMIERGVNAPASSSAGRLFDAVAWLLGGPDRLRYEGEAAIWLESIAGAEDAGYPIERIAGEGGPAVLDVRPLVRAVVADVARGVAIEAIAGRFHAGLASAVASECIALAESRGLADVAVSGGVFQNARLTELLVARLRRAGLRPLLHQVVPPNDGGLALGQLAVAAARDEVG